MGGALATLAAYELAVTFPEAAENIVCYSFACPRVGNAAWAADCDRVLVHNWRVVNEQDVVRV